MSRAETPTSATPKLSPTTLRRNLQKVQSKDEPPPLPSNRPIRHAEVVNINGYQRPAPAPSEIKLSSVNGQLLAASIPQLIAQITSPKLLDYELLSDFFLTYRLFMTSSDLATRLIDRLQHAIRSSDEFSRIVRVRTFVALRHWILNYFVDDFVSDFDLRARFCVLVNRLCRTLQRDSPQRVGDLRIVEELKKCWRHTCALFWDIHVTPNVDVPYEDILPGGHVGSRTTPQDWDDGQLGSTGSLPSLKGEDIPKEPSPADSFEAGDFAFNQTHKLGSSTISSASSLTETSEEQRQSLQAKSCSIPASVFPGKQQKETSLGPRPLPSATKPAKQPNLPPSSAIQAKKHHSRSGSFSDALRDDRVPLPIPQGEGEAPIAEAPPMIPPGSLIRGATVSPGTPYVETTVAQSPTQEVDALEFPLPSPSIGTTDQRGRQVQSPSPGMRRFIGTVRRALSAKNTSVRTHTPSPHRGRDDTKPPSNASQTPTNRETSAQKRKLVDGKAALRIDMLAAEVQESFKAAVRQVQEAQEALQLHQAQILDLLQYGEPYVDQGSPWLQIPQTSGRDTTVTAGSRSIVIMDDTNGQITPHAHLHPPEHALGQRQDSQVSSIRPHGPGVQSVPLFLDNGNYETTESLDDESQFYSETSTAQTHNWPTMSDSQHTVGSLSRVPDPMRTPTARDTSQAQVTETEVSSRESSLAGATTVTEDTQTSTNDPFHLERAPTRQLRRLPAGNLRAANHVHSLDCQSQAVSSATMSSVLHSPPVIPPRTSSTNVGDQHPETSSDRTNEESLVAAHTSQPVLRPSFEREVAKLAQIPDTAEENNGIESALAKLEGRGEASPSEPPADFLAALEASGVDIDSNRQVGDHGGITNLRQSPGSQAAEVSDPILATDAEREDYPQLLVQQKPISMTESTVSHSSIPLLERGASHPPGRKVKSPTDGKQSHAKATSTQTANIAEASHQSSETVPGSEGSYELVEEDESLQRARAGKRPALSERTHQSFLLNDNETLSELSSATPNDISDEDLEASPGMKSFFDENGGDSERHSPERHYASTPPRRSESGSVIPRTRNPVPQSPTDEYQVDPAYVPGTRPMTRENSVLSHMQQLKQSDEHLRPDARASPLTHAPSAAHMPFILAYDSLSLAQQLTVVERDALCEIDWRDLIDLRWNQTATAYYNWVDYLRSNSMTDAQGNPLMRPGVDMCIARFNLVVRWVKSEVVLTQDISERAATIVKYIHVAQHARKLRNWATMYQISMALVSADMSRLKQTWTMVPEAERDALAQLEDLIMPRRNFHNLRIEIEQATSTWAQGGEGGCVPFIGIYTHDLIYNAQKPAKVRATPRAAGENNAFPEPHAGQEHANLINFERHHTAATIVKNLLRLIEASSKYSFQAKEEMTSLCLWIGALHDAEVTRRSKELEPFERSSA